LENYTTVAGRRKFLGIGERFYVGDVVKGEKLARYPGIWTKVAERIKQQTENELKVKKLTSKASST
jgi:hypothetical protein